MRKSILVLAVIVAAIAAAVAVGFVQRHSSAMPYKPIDSGYTVLFTDTANGKPIANVRRLVKSNGDWLQITDKLNPDGTVSTAKVAGTAAFGATGIDDADRKLVSMGHALRVQAVTQDLRAAPAFLRDDTVLGMPAVVQGSCTPEGQCTEFWVAPQLSNDIIKVVRYNNKTGDRFVREPISLTFGEPSFAVPTDYPITRSKLLPPTK